MFDWQSILVLQKTISYTAMPFLMAAAYSDIKTFRIPNRFVIAIALLGILHLILLYDPVSAKFAVAWVSAIFIVGLLLFSFRMIGGGDVKLIMATILLLRYRDYYEFFFLMAVFGALLALGMLAVRHYAIYLGARAAAFVATTRLAVPYGVAIGLAGIVTLLMQPIMFRYSVFPTPFLIW